MLNVFLDTNVIIDFMAHRDEFFDDAAIIVSLAINKKLKLHVASMSFATASYILSRKVDDSKVKMIIGNFCNFCKVDVVDADCVEYGVTSKFKDFEDAMQFRCAQNANVDYIITRNVKDFEESTITALTPIIRKTKCFVTAKRNVLFAKRSVYKKELLLYCDTRGTLFLFVNT